MLLELKDELRNQSIKSLQRMLREMQNEGLVESHTIGRSVVYSLSKPSTVKINDFFLTKIWSELFEIEKEARYHLPPSHYIFAFESLRNLIALMPHGIKEKIALDVNKFKNSQFKEDKDADALREDLLNLIGRLSSLLHEHFDQLPKEQ
jgi:hypothetical protein